MTYTAFSMTICVYVRILAISREYREKNLYSFSSYNVHTCMHARICM